MSIAVKVRFAPSPTGRLHVGNARVALINWLFARKAGGQFLLRLDDTDTERSTEVFAEAIGADLLWLGLDHDQTFRQSDRLALYADAAARLKAAGRLYPCYETAEELDLKRKLARASHRPPVYDRAALKLDDTARAKLEAEGRKPHWRFRLDHGMTRWTDLVHGPIEIDTASLSDPVLVREDGRPLYTLSSVVDDGLEAISHIIRGEDHITNTAAQIQIMEALGYAVPGFAHLALLVGADGEGLSKRLGSLSLGSLRDEGVEPMAINSLLARLGSADPVEPHAALAELIGGFDIARFGRAPAHFDPRELHLLNARILHSLSFDAVKSRVPQGTSAALWDAVRGNLATLADLGEWRQVVDGPIDPVLEGDAVRARAIELLPPAPWNDTTWESWCKAITAATGAKGRALFHPLRLALTGRDKGPEMKRLLPLIGPERTRARLMGQKA